MKKKSIISILLICILISWGCNKKFKHLTSGETSLPTHCELCDYADQISGQYRGYSETDGDFPDHDSLTIALEHIFLELGPKIDSNVMYFRRTEDFDTKPTHIDTVAINSNDGNFYPEDYPGNYYNSCTMKVMNDSMYIHHGVTYHIGFAVLMDFKGKKIP